MSSLDKSRVIDFYREYPENCICEIGECDSDFDAIMTSNIGINLREPKNRNTILCHFYAADSNILSLKKIIRDKSRKNEYIMFMIHSSELMPNGSPNFKNNSEIEKLYNIIERCFKYAQKKGYIGITLRDYYLKKYKQ